MRKKFTLIELIVVIAVLGILAAIIIPNISNVQQKAMQSAWDSNVQAIQTATDMYSIENGVLPTKDGQPTTFESKEVKMDAIYPEYIRSLPKDTTSKFWIDANHNVWASSILPPQNVKNVGGVVTWDSVEGATAYEVYEVTNSQSSSAATNGAIRFKLLSTVAAPTTTFTTSATGQILVSAVDKNGHSTAPTAREGGTEVSVDKPSELTFTVSKVYSNAVTFDYSAKNATSFSVSVNGGTPIPLDSKKSVLGLDPKTTYNFVLHATNGKGTTTSESISGATTMGFSPISNPIQVISKGTDSVTLRMKAGVPGTYAPYGDIELSYQLYKDGVAYGKPILSKDEVDITVDGLEEGESYVFKYTTSNYLFYVSQSPQVTVTMD